MTRLSISGSASKLAKASLAIAILCLGATGAQAATVIGATTIKITGGPGADYLQIAELIAKNYAGVNVAPTATFTANSVYPGSPADYYGPQNLVDGVLYNSDDLYHSAGTGAGEFVLVTFAAPQDLSSLSIFGRVDLATYRNVYNVEIRNGSNSLLYSGTLDARGADPKVQGPATTVFEQSAPPVPEPATWAMMVFGFGAVGFGMRRRKAAGVTARVRYSCA